MAKHVGRNLVFGAMVAVLVSATACDKFKKNNDNADGQGANNGGPPPGGQWAGGPGGQRGPIGEIMAKLTKGPQSLTNVIGRELNEETPPWGEIQPQTKEYVQLAGSMGKYDPPKGDKESWQKMTSAFTQSATDLERAAAAKDTQGAKAAHTALTKSCQSCHQAHRAGPGMMMGGKPGGFRGPGGGPGGPPRPPQ